MTSLRPDTPEPDLAVVRSTQTPAEFNEQVAAFTAQKLDELRSGRRKPISTRRIDVNPHTGIYTSRVSRRGGAYSRPRVVAVSRRQTPHVAVHSLMPRRRDARRSRRSAARGRSNRSRAPSGSSGGGSEPDPPEGPPNGFARGAVVSVRDLGADGVTRAAFHAAIDRGLGSDIPDSARFGIFMWLDATQRAALWSAVRAEIDAKVGAA